MGFRRVEITCSPEKRDELTNLLDKFDLPGLTRVKGDNSVIFTFPTPAENVGALLGRLRQIGCGSAWGYVYISNMEACRPMSLPSKKSLDKGTTNIGRFFDRRIAIEEILAHVSSGGEITFEYIAFTLIAAVVAGVGLATNNTVMIVASMLLSPLMGPILSVTLGAVIHSKGMVRRGFIAEALGVLLALLGGLALGVVFYPFRMHYRWPTDEMLSRGSPESLIGGLVYSIPSGAAVALAITSSASSALVGVAIAASLLPPIVNTGLLLTWSFIAAARGDHSFTRVEPRYDAVSEGDPSFRVVTFTLPSDLFAMAGISFALFLINVVLIFVVGLGVFVLKSVAPVEGKGASWWHELPQLAVEPRTQKPKVARTNLTQSFHGMVGSGGGGIGDRMSGTSGISAFGGSGERGGGVSPAVGLSVQGPSPGSNGSFLLSTSPSGGRVKASGRNATTPLSRHGSLDDISIGFGMGRKSEKGSAMSRLSGDDAAPSASTTAAQRRASIDALRRPGAPARGSPTASATARSPTSEALLPKGSNAAGTGGGGAFLPLPTSRSGGGVGGVVPRPMGAEKEKATDGSRGAPPSHLLQSRNDGGAESDGGWGTRGPRGTAAGSGRAGTDGGAQIGMEKLPIDAEHGTPSRGDGGDVSDTDRGGKGGAHLSPTNHEPVRAPHTPASAVHVVDDVKLTRTPSLPSSWGPRARDSDAASASPSARRGEDLSVASRPSGRRESELGRSTPSSAAMPRYAGGAGATDQATTVESDRTTDRWRTTPISQPTLPVFRGGRGSSEPSTREQRRTPRSMPQLPPRVSRSSQPPPPSNKHVAPADLNLRLAALVPKMVEEYRSGMSETH